MRNSIEVAHYIESVLNRVGMKPTELANRIGVDRSTVTRYLKGTRKINMEDIPKIASAIGVSPIDLLMEEGAETSKENEYDYIPVSASAGQLSTIEGVTKENVEKIILPNSLLGKHAGDKDIFFMRVNGDSMNKVIPHESLIAVKRINLDALNNDDIVVFSNDHDYSVKRYFNDVDNKRLNFSSESKDRRFTDQTFSYEDTSQLLIHGKVILYIVSTD